MAITATHYELFKSLPLPRGGSLLEIGEANWYGDMNPARMYDHIEGFDGFNFDGCPVASQVREAIASKNQFAICKAFYAATFAPSRLVAVDWNGTPSALRQDLNETLDLDETFDVVINHGTAEHIFNIAQVFRTIHYRCEVGGLMVHDAPFTGWIDHGFYCLHPTLFYDLAMANCYEVVKVAIHTIEGQQIIPVDGRDHVARLAAAGKIPQNAMLFVAFRKLNDAPFKVPMQGYYARTISEAGQKAWRELR
jgi:hypothetical protein